MELLHGDCIEVMAGLPAASVGAVVTDPPYGLGFMGREWDTFDAGAVALRAARKARKGTAIPAGSGELNAAGYVEYDYSRRGLHGFQSWCEGWGRECLRVLKPGGYLVSFGSPRTYHRLASGLEDAGFVIKDSLMWLYGSGFPKSLNLGDGIGTALKPAHEPIVLAQKPLQGTYAANVARWGVGGLAIDGCRVATDEIGRPRDDRREDREDWRFGGGSSGSGASDPLGRWPANVLLDEEAAALLDAQSGERKAGGYVSGLQTSATGDNGIYGHFDRIENRPYADSGGASRFFYVAKAARSEREKGLRALAQATPGERTGRADGSAGLDSPRAGAGRTNAGANIHPTVKPVALMRWLVRLVTPPGETVLDPFLGSGTTGVAATMEGRAFIGIEREAQYLEIARHRLIAAQPGLPLGAA